MRRQQHSSHTGTGLPTDRYPDGPPIATHHRRRLTPETTPASTLRGRSTAQRERLPWLNTVTNKARNESLRPYRRQGAISYLVKWAGRDEDKRKAVIPALKAMIETPGEPNVVYCLRVAGGYGPAAAELLPLIEPLAASRNEGVRIAAVDAAARIRGQRKD